MEFITYFGGNVEPSFKIINNKFRIGLFLTSNIETAKVYGNKIYELTIKINQPFIIDCKGNNYSEILKPKQMYSYTTLKTVDTDLIVAWAYQTGKYDSVIFKNIFEGNGNSHYSTVYNIFNNTSILKYKLYAKVQNIKTSGVNLLKIIKENNMKKLILNSTQFDAITLLNNMNKEKSDLNSKFSDGKKSEMSRSEFADKTRVLQNSHDAQIAGYKSATK